MGASFRANQMSVHAETARDQRDGRTDGQTDGFSALYSRLAKVPTLSCRLGRVPYDSAFGALIVHFLSITKSVTEEKQCLCQDLNVNLLLVRQIYNHYSTLEITNIAKRNVVFITNCIWAAVYRSRLQRSYG